MTARRVWRFFFPPPRRKRFSRAKRRQVWEKSRGRCTHCSKPLVFNDSAWHVDHLKPRSRGGSDDLSNLAAACASCNLKKGSQDWGRSRRSRLPLLMAAAAAGGIAIVVASQSGQDSGRPVPQAPTFAAQRFSIYAVANTGQLGLKVRAAPDGNQLGTVYDGDQLLVLESSGTWRHVRGDNFDGWVSGAYLTGPRDVSSLTLSRLK